MIELAWLNVLSNYGGPWYLKLFLADNKYRWHGPFYPFVARIYGLFSVYQHIAGMDLSNIKKGYLRILLAL